MPGAMVDSDGKLQVVATNPDGTNIGGTGGTAHTDDAAFTPAVDDGTVMMAVADETAPDSVDEGDAGAVRMTLSRILWTALRGKGAASGDTELRARTPADAAALVDALVVEAILKGSNGTSLDLLRTLAASGNGLGVLDVGHKVGELTLLNALAVRDDVGHDISWTSIALYPGKKVIEISTTLDQPITWLDVYMADSVNYPAVAQVYSNHALSIANNVGAILQSGAAAGAAVNVIVLPQLDLPCSLMYFSLKCGVAPASGSVTVKLLGGIGG